MDSEQQTKNGGNGSSLLDYQKTILEKVSFDQQIFEKELEKAGKWLQKDELRLLVDWVLTTFSQKFTNLYQKVRELFSHLLGELLPAPTYA